jgi:hypothetical protein
MNLSLRKKEQPICAFYHEVALSFILSINYIHFIAV